jgi:glycosyltransferase involved in cell wall biosynthesis
VSIIIPTYNSEETLKECLKSILGQNYPSCEIIVVDNFSSDNTLKIARDFGAKIIRQKSTPALARNIGIANSSGEYLLFIDSDQILSPSVIEECIEKCESGEAGMVIIPEVFIGKSFWGLCSAVWKNYHKFYEHESNGKHKIRGEPRFFVKQEVIRAGMLNSNLLWGEDLALHIKLRELNVKAEVCKKSKLYHYEPSSLKEMIIKNLRYGRSMSMFMQQTGKQIFPVMFRSALLTLREVFQKFKSSPLIIVGCVLLLCLKAYTLIIGLLLK